MMPQNVNFLGNVHGGVIMMHVDEIAGAVAAIHGLRRESTQWRRL